MKRTVFGKRLVLLAFVLGLVAGCASTPPKDAGDKNAEVKQAIDARPKLLTGSGVIPKSS